MNDIPEFIKGHQAGHIVQFVRSENKCPYCLQRFNNPPTAIDIAKHVNTCVKKLESQKSKS